LGYKEVAALAEKLGGGDEIAGAYYDEIAQSIGRRERAGKPANRLKAEQATRNTAVTKTAA
jgi:hypothetical protein